MSSPRKLDSGLAAAIPSMIIVNPTWRRLIPIGLILAVIMAYANSFTVPFLFDDEGSITNNPTIRQLWPLGPVLHPPGTGTTVTNRPLVNLSVALNYAAGGLNVSGYHLFNLLVHLSAGLTLFGLVRRTFLQPGLVETFGVSAVPLAGLVSLGWLLHPLQTESVSYVIQRAESLMGLLFLLTLYSAVRSMSHPGSRLWTAAAVTASLAGMATKEVMIMAPILVFLYDRTFVSGNFLAAAKRHWSLHLPLFLTTLLLVWLVACGDQGTRGGTTGFAGPITWWEYLLTQCYAVVHYLKLVFWPSPLVFEYGVPVMRDPAVLIPCIGLAAALVAATVYALWRCPAWGFVGAWFCGILAPSSSFVPVQTQTIAEHRMYLPLAAVLVSLVLALRALLPRRWKPVGVAFACVWLVLTIVRNHDYRSALAIWEDTAAKAPRNARALSYQAMCLLDLPGREADAIARFEDTLAVSPNYAEGHNNFAFALMRMSGREADAIAHFQTALRLKPDYAEAHNNLANLLVSLPGREDEALAHYEEALKLKTDYVEAHNNLASLFARDPDKRTEALSHYEAALRISPDYAEGHNNLAILLAEMSGREDEAVAHYKAALRLRPDFPEAHNNFANLLATQPGQRQEAEEHYTAALRLRPAYPRAHFGFAELLRRQPARSDEAIAHYVQALELRPAFLEARTGLDAILDDLGRKPEVAIDVLTLALGLVPAAPETRLVHYRLGLALETIPGRHAEARAHFEKAMPLRPGSAEAADLKRRLGSAGP